MGGSIQEEIRKIILNKKINPFDKIILIYKYIDKGKDWKKLSEVLDLPVELLQEWNPVPIIEKKPAVKNSLTKEFISTFQDMYKELRGRYFKMDGKEAGQMGYVAKKIKKDEWIKILKLIKHNAEQYGIGRKFKNNTWRWIVENITPTRINKDINFLLGEIAGKKITDKNSDDWGFEKK